MMTTKTLIPWTEITTQASARDTFCDACRRDIHEGDMINKYQGFEWHASPTCDKKALLMIVLDQEEPLSGWLRLNATDDDGDVDPWRWYTRRYHYFVDSKGICRAKHIVDWGDFAPVPEDFEFPSVEWQCKDCARRFKVRQKKVVRFEEEWEKVRGNGIS